MSLGVDDSRIDLDFSKMEAFLNNIWKPFPPFIWCETSEREWTVTTSTTFNFENYRSDILTRSSIQIR